MISSLQLSVSSQLSSVLWSQASSFSSCLYHRGHLCYHGRYVVITAVIIILTALFAVVFVIVIIIVIAFIVMTVVNDIIMEIIFIVVGVAVNVTAVDDMVIAIVMSPVRLFDWRSFGLAWGIIVGLQGMRALGMLHSGSS